MSKLFLSKLFKEADKIKDLFDQQAIDVIDDLLGRATSFKNYSFHDNCHVFTGKREIFGMGKAREILDQYGTETMAEFKESQFQTFEEDALYCKGTEQLLGLMTRYRHVQTPNFVVMASPASAASETVNGVTRSVINRDEMKYQYGKKRSVLIMVICQHAFFSFYFEETVRRA